MTLTGAALIAHHFDNNRATISKEEMVKTAGYLRDNGKAAYTDYYKELLFAQGKVSKVKVTITDTFGGEPNYSWAQFETVYIPQDKDPIRYIKKAIAYTGIKCDKVDMGDTVMLYPRGMCRVIIIQWM